MQYGFWGIPVNQPDQPCDEVLSDAAKWQLLQCRPKGLRVFGHLRRYVNSSPMGKDRLPNAMIEGGMYMLNFRGVEVFQGFWLLFGFSLIAC